LLAFRSSTPVALASGLGLPQPHASVSDGGPKGERREGRRWRFTRQAKHALDGAIAPSLPPLGTGEEKQAERNNHDDERQALAGTNEVGARLRSPVLAASGTAGLEIEK
jgi:hypothetical protein